MDISKLQKAIERKKISKAVLAERSGITRRTLDNILSGSDAKISTIETIANVLGVSVGYFFGEETPRTVHTEGDYSPAVNTGTFSAIVGADAAIAERLAAKDAIIAAKDTIIATKDEVIAQLKARLTDTQ